MSSLERVARALNVASWVAFAAAAWFAGAAAAASAGQQAVLRAGLATKTVLGVPVLFYAAAAGMLLQLLRSRAEGALKLFHVPDRVRPRYPLNSPGI